MKNTLAAISLSIFLAGCAGSETDSTGSRSSEATSASTVAAENIAPLPASNPAPSGGWSNSFQSVSDAIDKSMQESAARRDARQDAMNKANQEAAQQENFRRDASALRSDYMHMLGLVGILGVGAKAMNPSSPDCNSQEVTERWMKDTNQVFQQASQPAALPTKQVPPT